MSVASPALRLLIAGSSGAVGQEVLRLALLDQRIHHIVAPTRRPLPSHPKLSNPLVDFTALPADANWWQVDAVICTLGTTIKLAGSKAAFAAIDRDLPIEIARLARAAGARSFALNSSLGANLRGNFYLRTKAQAEMGISALGYPSVTIVRPSLIDASRAVARPAEQAGLVLARFLRPLIPARYRAVKAEAIATALLDGVMNGAMSALPGVHYIESEQITGQIAPRE